MSDAQMAERLAYYKHALEEAQARLDKYGGDDNGRKDCPVKRATSGTSMPARVATGPI